MKVLFIFGTRPEAIKLAPVINSFKNDYRHQVTLCVTGQHRQLLDQVMDIFSLRADFDLSVMEDNQNLFDITTKVLSGLKEVISQAKPDLIFVHGDTTTTMAASIAAFYFQIPLAHIEAGLRTWDNYSPWPEEANRKIVSQLAKFHFAPTENSKANLLRNGIDEDSIYVVGNSALDAVKIGFQRLENDGNLMGSIKEKYSYLNPAKKLVLVTCHRRENFEFGIKNICESILLLAKRDDVQILWPVHPNPNIFNYVHQELSHIKNIFLTPPLEYLEFIYLMSRSYLMLTDSGGIQEEAPFFKKPVLVLRESTERPEAVESGTVRVVGTNPQEIQKQVISLLDNEQDYSKFQLAKNPYGDGSTSEKILEIISKNSLNMIQ